MTGKWILRLGGLAMAVALLAGCSTHEGNTAADEPPPPPPPAQPAPTPSPAPVPSPDGTGVGTGAGALVLRSARSPALPAFEPWPPPTPTSQDVIARTLVVGKGAATWGAVSDRFESALAAAGYEDRAYYAVPGGFALATRIERIDSKGRPLSEPARWIGPSGRHEWTLEAVLRELAGVPVGRYRAMVFVFSDTPFHSGGARMSEAMAEHWRRDGLNRLPAALRMAAYDAGFQCDVLVYEFQLAGAGQPATFVEAGLSVRRHLASSQILHNLEQPQ